MSTKREAAHEAVRRGFTIFPIAPDSKVPLLKENWLQIATTDAKQIDAWWDAHPDANIAGLTGDKLIFDIDKRHGGLDTWSMLKMVEDFPDTSWSVTAGGGAHMIYQMPDGQKVKAGAHKAGQGIDIKGDGGYILLPGSTIKGIPYQWGNTRPASFAPQWAIDRYKGSKKKTDKAGQRIVEEDDKARELAEQWLASKAPTAEYGQIDDTTYKVAARLYDFGCSQQTVLELTIDWNESHCNPPGDTDRLERVVESAGVNRENAIGSKHTEAPGFEPTEIDETKAPPSEPAIPAGDLIKSSAEFIKGFVPPEYLIDGMLQRRFCYSMTAQTGVGKTAIAMLLSSHVEAGRALDGLDVAKGPVLYFAGENPTDIQMRWLGLTKETKTDPETANVHFVPGVVPLSKVATRIAAEVTAKGLRPALVVVDTAAAYFEGDDENSNTQAVEHARRMRALTELPGGPCVLILCHPTKRANDDEMIPRGGGAFLAEVDGNIALHKRDNAIVASAQGKFRGPEFTPLSFALKTVQHPILVDAKGRAIPTVVARTIGEAEKQRLEVATVGAENALLKAVHDLPDATLRQLAEALGWRYKTGKVDHSKVGRGIDKLVKSKLLRTEGRGWRLTAAGDTELRRPDPFFEAENSCRTVATEPPGFDPKNES